MPVGCIPAGRADFTVHRASTPLYKAFNNLLFPGERTRITFYGVMRLYDEVIRRRTVFPLVFRSYTFKYLAIGTKNVYGFTDFTVLLTTTNSTGKSLLTDIPFGKPSTSFQIFSIFSIFRAMHWLRRRCLLPQRPHWPEE